jgi:hypothetical protein
MGVRTTYEEVKDPPMGAWTAYVEDQDPHMGVPVARIRVRAHPWGSRPMGVVAEHLLLWDTWHQSCT